MAGVSEFINYVLEDNHDFIVEGWQILPHMVRSIITRKNEEKIRTVFLYRKDENDILSSLKSSQAKNDWVIKNTKEEATFSAIAKMMMRFGNHITTECEKYELKSFNMDVRVERKVKTLVESFS